MIEKGGHWGRHYIAAPAHDCRVTLWERIKAWMAREPREGRRAIVPGMPIDNHAAGWYPATWPGKPKVSKGRSENPFVASAEEKSYTWQERI